MKKSWRRLEDVWPRPTYWSRRLEDVFWRRRRKTSWRRLEDIFVRASVCWEQNLVFQYNKIFLENWKFNHKLCPLLSSIKILCLKDYPHNLTKYETNGTSKIATSQLFSEFKKIWKCNLSLYSKNPIFHLFHELGKIEKWS